MLKVLKRIVQDVTAVAHLKEALLVLVSRVRQAVGADAVSVYLIDPKLNEFVLVATDGLNPKACGKVRIAIDDGLVGFVGRREEPINLDNAPHHPHYHHNPLLAEQELFGYLGVPIIQHRKLYGVMAVQQTEAKYFDDAEEAFLITLAAQFGGIIAHAEATGELDSLTSLPKKSKEKKEEKRLSLAGLPSVPGIAIGRAIVIYPQADVDSVPRQIIDDIAFEQALFLDALYTTQKEIERLGRRMKDRLGSKEHELFDVYVRILDKDGLGEEVLDYIEKERLNAEAALCDVIKQHVQQFEQVDDPYLQERASDFRDLGRRVLATLQKRSREQVSYPKKTVLVGEEVTASDLADVPLEHIVGVISARGSHNSHVAILARSLDIPTVMGVKGLKLADLEGRAVIVDGYLGEVYFSPTKALLYEYMALAEKEEALNQSLESLRDKPAETLDEYKVSLQVNTGLAMDASMALSVGAEGVGLYRSEIPFMSKDRFPSEDEQTIIYKQILKAFAPHPVTMRTLDIGGDKVLPYFPVKEDNPYLGWRGIRVTLDHPDVFLLQVRAMMRASEELDNLRIMLPMVTSLGEIDEAIFLIEQAYQELLEEGFLIQKPPIGVMIEVPAAVYMAKDFAKRVDFLSVGSNDLTQYLLAVDRNNARVASLYDPLHPAIIRTLIKIVEGAHAAGVKVSLCGEMASDPLAVLILLAIGFDTLSMNSSSLLRVKWMIRNLSLASSRRILADVLALEHPKDIRHYLQEALEQEGLCGFIRTGRSHDH